MNNSRMFRRLALLSLLSVLVILPASARKKQQAQELPTPKYVFFMIGDGMGINEVYGAQNYNQVTGDGPRVINFTQFPVRTFVTTFSSSSLVTDSAASGTALSSGVKTYNNAIGVDPDHNPVNSICVWAHEKGFGTGVATTVGVNHATPAAFYAHADHRNEYEKIATQLIEESDFIDFAAGGGFLTETQKTGHNGKYFEDKAREAGIAVLRGRDQFRNIASQKGRVICLNSDPNATEIKFGIDQRGDDTTLSDLVQAGIDYLYGKFGSKGFFFMVECGEIDGAGHNNDAKTNIMEVNDFHKTIELVLSFCEQHPDECLILVTADHETGGLQLGENYIMHPELLTTQKWSEDEINKQFRALAGIGPDRAPLPNRVVPTYDQVKAFLSQHLGLWSTIEVDEKQEAAFKEMYHRAFELNEEEIVESLYSVSNRIVSEAIVYANRKAGYLWAHGAHTGSPVGLYVYGARAAEFNACTDNTQICKTIQRLAKY
ncbi:MAG: alkaline phosphatase [Bacteroidales bacterium]|nr:alkaline phosphatase [Bacteroidales bacterium]